MAEFVHLHNHTIYSILDGVAKPADLINRAKEFGMTQMALTDHGNLFGIMEFIDKAKKTGIKPIIGCEMYIVSGDMKDKKQDDERNYYHLILLVKNETGYKNLVKMTSLAYLEGFYRKPRIDKTLLRKHSEGLVCMSACIAGEPQRQILAGNFDKAMETVSEYKEIFGDDYYLEIQRHKDIPEEETVVKAFVEISNRTGIGLVATNDTHFALAEDAQLQEVMFAIADKKTLNDETRRRYHTSEIYLKSQQAMAELFSDIPQAIENSVVIANKCNWSDVAQKTPYMPIFEVPREFKNEHEYLEHLVHEGLKKRYSDYETNSAIKDRAAFELSVVKKMGFEGYFLIVQDLINNGRDNGVAVGPGRGSAAGSLVAYAVGITNIDPIKYNLLFERFLNPERVSMPDVDIDFQDDKRHKIIEYVKQKYGSESVCQILTFGYEKEKSAIRDVGRVIEYPLEDINKIMKMLNALEKNEKDKFIDASKNGKLVELAIKNGALDSPNMTPQLESLQKMASRLQGCIRQLGIHAAGIIIAPGVISDYVPLCSVKGEVATQFDKKYVEDAGLLKIDLLGLKTLSQICQTVEIIKKSRKIDIDPEKISLEDKPTWQLFGNGETVGVFQFESSGMSKYLKQLKPTCLEDIIAMNALYRPGPMKNIPKFISGKNSKEKVERLHPILEDVLKETYGIIVYQEQVMQIGQIMGGFTLGKADVLRRAMGKKDEKAMTALQLEFEEGAKAKGIDKRVAQRIFDLMLEFANYGFNKSHAAAYSLVAYQTAYLKANFSEEFLAATLSTEKSDAKKVRFFVEEARRKKIKVIPPDVNISSADFTTGKNTINFGLSAIKNIGEAQIDIILEEREKNGGFKDFFDFVARTNINRKGIEVLIKSGATDSLPGTREEKFESIDLAVNFAAKKRKKNEMGLISLFETKESANDGSDDIDSFRLAENTTAWTKDEILSHEIELIGFFTSGENPLSRHKREIELFTDFNFENSCYESCMRAYGSGLKSKSLYCAGVVMEIETRKNKRGAEFAFVSVEDFQGTAKIIFWPEKWVTVKEKIKLYRVYAFEVNLEVEYTDGDDNGEYSVDIYGNNVLALEKLREMRFDGVEFGLDVDNANFEELFSKIQSLCVKFSGTKRVCYALELKDYSLNFISKELKVSHGVDFINKIETELMGECQVNFIVK